MRGRMASLIAPVYWSDNWIELDAGRVDARSLQTAGRRGRAPVVQLEGWNHCAGTIHPQTESIQRGNDGRCPGDDAGFAVGLKRSLRFWDLVLYGIILIQPTAPMPSFGVIYQESHGHVVTAILLAMVAMLFTSVSYGRMARAYPQGGSAFLYVGKEIHPSLGYITGWCLVMDYVLNPLICTIWCSRVGDEFSARCAVHRLGDFLRLLVYAVNCNGVETSARINAGMAAALGVVIVLVLVAAVRWILASLNPGGCFFCSLFTIRARLI